MIANDKAFSIPKYLIRKYNTRDPFKLAEYLGIRVMLRDYFTTEKGVFFVAARNSYIFINSNLSEDMQRIVCAHELGHALMHRQYCIENGRITDYDFVDLKDGKEYDANVFSGNLTIDDDDLMELVNQGWDLVSIARELHSHTKLVELHLNEMQKRNKKYHFSLPEMPSINFLGQISDDPGSL